VIARVTALRGGADRSLDPILDNLVRELDAAARDSEDRPRRGARRVDRSPTHLDASMVEVLRQQTTQAALQQLEMEADEELKPFRARMPAMAYRESHRACVDRLLRERAGFQRLRTTETLITVDVEKPTAGGRMLARHNGQVVLVWGAIPGERVRARVERAAKGLLFAESIEVVSSRPIDVMRSPTGDAAATCSPMSATTASFSSNPTSSVTRSRASVACHSLPCPS
jgi:predicted RNA-binding protein with TRAM domain